MEVIKSSAGWGLPRPPFCAPYLFGHKQGGNAREGEQHKGEPKPDIAAVARLWAGDLLCPAAPVAARSACPRRAAVPSGENGGRDKFVVLNEAAEHSGYLGAGRRPLGAEYAVPIAAHDTAAYGPAHGRERPVGHVPGIGKAGQVIDG